jgi:N-acetylglutamate synthase-like GNAT family acetyltransferase
MIKMDIREPANKKELKMCFDFRHDLLIKPFGRPKKEHALEKGMTCIGVFDKGLVIGNGIVQKVSEKTARIRCMAVAEGYRNAGLGTKLLGKLEQQAMECGVKTIKLRARETSIRFYKNNGYVLGNECGMRFGKIRRFDMEKAIG